MVGVDNTKIPSLPYCLLRKKTSCSSCHIFNMQITSDSTFLYQSVSLSSSSPRVLCPPSHSLPAPSQHLHYHSHYHHLFLSLNCIHRTTKTPPHSLLVRCTAMPWWSTDKEGSQRASWFFQLESKHGHSQVVLKRFVHHRPSSTCSWCHLTDMTAMSVFMELPVIVAFISGVKCPLHRSNTSIPCFLRRAPGHLFHIKLTGHPTLRLASDNNLSKQFFPRQCSTMYNNTVNMTGYLHLSITLSFNCQRLCPVTDSII